MGIELRWMRMWRTLATVGGDDAAQAGLDVVTALYAQPPRPYHNLAHVVACLDLFNGLRPRAQRPNELAFALWMHDSFYLPAAQDNERRSAQLATLLLRGAGADPDAIGRVERLVLATQHDGSAETPDERLIADIDMSILAAPAEEYDRYAAAIRREFSHLTASTYERGRQAFLERVLARPRIFLTDALGPSAEADARGNIARELAPLRQGLAP